MTAISTSVPRLLAGFRQADVVLTANGDRLAFDAPAGVITPEMVAVLKARKGELLAVLRGDYLAAAAALVLSVPNAVLRDELVQDFDERAAIHEYEGSMTRREAERLAYHELADRTLDQ